MVTLQEVQGEQLCTYFCKKNIFQSLFYNLLGSLIKAFAPLYRAQTKPVTTQTLIIQ